MVYLFLATGFEETEAIATTDILLRGGVEVKLVSVTGEKKVVGTHGIAVETDALFADIDFASAELVILPGGMPGTNNLGDYAPLVKLLKERNANNEKIAAICAAPMVLGRNDILVGKKATCYPGCEGELKGALLQTDRVVTDGNITTSRGPATAPDFGVALLRILKGDAVADQVAADFLLK